MMTPSNMARMLATSACQPGQRASSDEDHHPVRAEHVPAARKDDGEGQLGHDSADYYPGDR